MGLFSDSPHFGPRSEHKTPAIRATNGRTTLLGRQTPTAQLRNLGGKEATNTKTRLERESLLVSSLLP